VKYPKIQSVWMRDPTTNHKTFLDEYARPEFWALRGLRWIAEEKIDGTNVRVMPWPTASGPAVEFRGRTDNAQLPPFLLDMLRERLDPATLSSVPGIEMGECVLYGEGYGARIQKGGGGYKEDGVGFCLFDVLQRGRWMHREKVYAIADALGVPHAPPLGRMTLAGAAVLCADGFPSGLPGAQRQAEGVVLRPSVELRDQHGERVIAKLKIRDFRS